jgi:hypothetical protein
LAVGAIEADQHDRGAGVDRRGDRAGVLDLKHRTQTDHATTLCRAKQVAVGVGNQPSMGKCSVWGAVEVDQCGGCAGVDRRGDRSSVLDLEYRTGPYAAGRACAEQVAVGVDDQPGGIGLFVVGAVQADQHGRGAGVDRRGDRAGVLNLEHRAIAVRAAIRSRAKQVAVGVDGQWALGIPDIGAVELTKVVS